ncbi:MAG: ADP-ribosylglycohydrolase family protein [Armatimonadetes bacterium]|nr:ADP-ribosylglycohydrolase family protein [Armatimonadota bacterium]
MATLGRDTYRSKVYGCWLGKSIGGTLGGPHEGKAGPLELTFYDPVPTEPMFNDDLDLQLVWLHALEEHGLEVTPEEISQEWLDHITYPWCEYGFSNLNAKRGLIPPMTGAYDNWFGDCMGSPIRSEIWACIAPGAPHLACEYAWRDAVRDHWGEGVWGEMFFAAVESAAFVLDDKDALIDLGLAAIPPWSKIAQAVDQARDSYRRGYTWDQARRRALAEFGQQHMTNAPQNFAFTVIGWLYGEDFGDALLKAVNCGCDTDCTGATLGAILGLLYGEEGIPADWREPIAEGIKVGWGIVNLDVPQELGELTERTCAVGEQVAAHLSDVIRLTDGEGKTADLEALRRHAARAMFIWDRRPDEVWLTRDAGTRVWYMGGPTITPGRPKRLAVVGASGVGVKAPEGWQVEVKRVDSVYELVVHGPEDMGPFASLEISAEGERKSVALVRRPEWQVGKATTDDFGDQPPEPESWVPWHAEGYQMNFRTVLAGGEGTVVARTRLVVPEETEATLILATPHKVGAWLNGERVVYREERLANDEPPYNIPPGSQAKVTLRAGDNDLTIALHSLGGSCWVRAYLVDEAGHGLPEVIYADPGQ